MDGWVQKRSWYKIKNKPKMVRFFKIKFLIALKLKLNGGQFYKKNWLLQKVEKTS